VPSVEDPEKKLQNLQQRKWVYFAGQMKRHCSTVLSFLFGIEMLGVMQLHNVHSTFNLQPNAGP
jgi:hypothetical protein